MSLLKVNELQDLNGDPLLGANGGLTRGTAQATTSGTEFTFSGIPSGVSRISVVFRQVSLSGTNTVRVQLGTSGGFTTSGYESVSGRVVDASNSTVGLATTGFHVNSGVANDGISGTMLLERVDGNQWVASHSVERAAAVVITGGAFVDLAGELTQLRINASGADTFDAGKVNILYQ